jgi:hypothetical protein
MRTSAQTQGEFMFSDGPRDGAAATPTRKLVPNRPNAGLFRPQSEDL